MSVLEQTPPEWAYARAIELSGLSRIWTAKEASTVRNVHLDAFARYIAEHEDEPVDPLLIEARKIVAARGGNDGSYYDHIMSGVEDDGPAVQNCLTALRRGIELAKSEATS